MRDGLTAVVMEQPTGPVGLTMWPKSNAILNCNAIIIDFATT